VNDLIDALILGVRWWWLNVCHVFICARIALICFFISGCATHPVAPSQDEVNAQSAISSSMSLSQKIEAESQYLQSH